MLGHCVFFLLVFRCLHWFDVVRTSVIPSLVSLLLGSSVFSLWVKGGGGRVLENAADRPPRPLARTC